MQKLIEVKVECYSGYKADERPRCFYIGNMRFEIQSITDRWYQYQAGEGSDPADYFRIQTTDSKNYILKHRHDINRWYLVVRGESITMPCL